MNQKTCNHVWVDVQADQTIEIDEYAYSRCVNCDLLTDPYHLNEGNNGRIEAKINAIAFIHRQG